MTTMTLEERERYAYIAGLSIAPILALAADNAHVEALKEEVHDLQCRIDDARIREQQLKSQLQQIALLCAGTR